MLKRSPRALLYIRKAIERTARKIIKLLHGETIKRSRYREQFESKDSVLPGEPGLFLNEKPKAK